MARDYYETGQVYFGEPDPEVDYPYTGLSPEEQAALQRRLVAAQVQPEPVAPQVPDGLIYSPLQNANVNAFTVQQQREREAAQSQKDNIAAQEQAIKLRGQMNYQRDIQAGLSPRVAFQNNMADLLFSHPEKMAAGLKTATPAPEFINATPIRAGDKTLGYSVIDPLSGRPQSTSWSSSDKPTYDQQQAHRVAMQAWRNATQAVNSLQRMNPTDRILVPDYKERLSAATEASALAEQAAKSRAPNLVDAIKTGAPSATKESPESVRDQYRAGKLTRAEAESKLKQLGFK
jgi:hypothetical protein